VKENGWKRTGAGMSREADVSKKKELGKFLLSTKKNGLNEKTSTRNTEQPILNHQPSSTGLGLDSISNYLGDAEKPRGR